jgi:5-oxoprolinase (ATP-hydrolysing)
MNSPDARWQFWIDRGGTFTDVVAHHPDGSIITHKLLSENPERYADAALEGIREILRIPAEEAIPKEAIDAIKMGTTVGTNALLERKGERTALLITRGFGDSLRIGYQNRPDIFALDIKRPDLLYECVIEVTERCSAQGEILVPLDEALARRELQHLFDGGIRSVAIVLMHAWRSPQHERELAKLARDIGFTQISVSHEVSPLIKLIGRGDTTVVDAYLSPLLRRYVEQVAKGLGAHSEPSSGGNTPVRDRPRLMFMQSNGGLIDAHYFQGKDSILSGPAGGIVGAVATATMAGFDKIITFDMGGTSTDVAHYAGEYERSFETEVAGVRMRTPMMHIHTVAAGGGSILHFDGMRYRVGPDSAGADPGPVCYRRGGPLCVTDANVMVGKLPSDYFPKVFGPNGGLSLDDALVKEQFIDLAADISKAGGTRRTPEEVAEGFLAVAVENMAAAIKKISVQRGYDVSEYALCCFGAAGGQHACLVADRLGITRIFLHPYAGVLSAYGMGLADFRLLREQAVEQLLDGALMPALRTVLDELEKAGRIEMEQQSLGAERVDVLRRVHLRYQGTDTSLIVDFDAPKAMRTAFETRHRERFGFIYDDKKQIVEAVSVEVIGVTQTIEDPLQTVEFDRPLQPRAHVDIYSDGAWQETPVFERSDLRPGAHVTGPAIIIEPTSTTVIEPGWQGHVSTRNHLILTQAVPLARRTAIGTSVDPVMLEIFNKLYMSIAEQMGYTLQNTAHSVNIKERLDFSCAVFDARGELIANAPHIPVHLGSMGESVQALIRSEGHRMKQGDAFLLNSPYHGGTHLPDITVVTPVFDEEGQKVLFYVASRGHHADIGGVTPGSMPPQSHTIDEEGVLCDGLKLLDQGRFLEQAALDWLLDHRYPARNPEQNIADLRAQIAANAKGVQELNKMVAHYSLATVQAYMRHVQDNAAEAVRRMLGPLADGSFVHALDDGAEIHVRIRIDRQERRARIDFTGTSPQQPGNFNAPAAVCKAAVLYVLRTLVQDDIPLNAGCLRPIELIIPEGSMLNPRPPAAVVAGNVETSQYIVDALYGALGVMAASQGTMNNLTFGSDRWQYYETICGGAGAGPDFDGCDAVHTHMTNSRITDPEVLEWRFPVLLEAFAIRTNSGGNGRHRGGNGVVRRIRFLESMTAAILASHRLRPPFGLFGGESGACGHDWVQCADGSIVELQGCDRIDMQPGDVLVIETPGGGGYGKAPAANSDQEPGKP